MCYRLSTYLTTLNKQQIRTNIALGSLCLFECLPDVAVDVAAAAAVLKVVIVLAVVGSSLRVMKSC